jgi:serine/threonine protein kinase/Flp pilus assembly protein TadD
MRCPNCAGDVSDKVGRCPACNALLPSSVVTGLLTPVPRDEAETVFASPSRPLHPPTVPPSAPDTTGLPVSAGGRSPSGPLKIGQQFGTRYHILKELGIGGMGAVYQAWDAELEVAVALKVIRPEVTRDPIAAQDIERRFKQELLLARQVTHRNVVRIHDLGEIDGIKYITMPYIEGADLATVLRDRRLTVPQVLTIARQIAAGLQAAHEAGVVHRDLKPANVMIENEHAIIMDFGIARSTSRGAPAPRPSTLSPRLTARSEEDVTRIAATMVGEVIGTIEYMAPEQARGEHVDQRADVYAFGLIVYDMLVGRRRSEHAVSAVGELQERLAHAPRSVRAVVPAVPEALDGLVTKCIQPELDKRFQSTAELVAALDLLDDNGKLKPKKRVVRLPVMVGMACALLALSGYIYWNTRPVAQHDPVSVVISDIQNTTNDTAFNNTLEPILRIALEEAQFISAYDRLEVRRTLGVAAADIPTVLDEAAGRQIAVSQGLGVVVSGSLSRQGDRFELSMRVVEAVSGNEIASFRNRASSREQVLAAATTLASSVRGALGDDPSDTARRFAQETLSTTSLDVIGAYARGSEAFAARRFDEAIQEFSKAVELDPNFGLAYTGMAAASRNLGRRDEAEKYLNNAIAHLEGMTERERYRTRALSYGLTGDYKACVTEYRDLIAKYTGDAASRNNLALCAAYLRDWPAALAELRRLVTMLPKRVLYRTNLATYLSYAGDFPAAEEAARKEGDAALLSLAFAQQGQGRQSEAADTYQKLAATNSLGASRGTSGLADVAAYEGRFSEAARILREGAATDMKNGESGRAATKIVQLAQIHAIRGERAAAITAANEALAASQAIKIQFLAARVFVAAGTVEPARMLAEKLASQFQAEPRAYSKIIAGEIALVDNPRQAITLLMEANELFDTWIGHLDLGRAYLDAGGTLQAEGEFDRCITRRGEALSLFLDEEPTYSNFPQAYYYQGRVREAMKSPKFDESYRRYLDIRGNSTEDPLVREVRKRAGI